MSDLLKVKYIGICITGDKTSDEIMYVPMKLEDGATKYVFFSRYKESYIHRWSVGDYIIDETELDAEEKFLKEKYEIRQPSGDADVVTVMLWDDHTNDVYKSTQRVFGRDKDEDGFIYVDPRTLTFDIPDLRFYRETDSVYYQNIMYFIDLKKKAVEEHRQKELEEYMRKRLHPVYQTKDEIMAVIEQKIKDLKDCLDNGKEIDPRFFESLNELYTIVFEKDQPLTDIRIKDIAAAHNLVMDEQNGTWDERIYYDKIAEMLKSYSFYQHPEFFDIEWVKSQFDDPEEKKRAQILFEKLKKGILSGKYGFENMYTFMTNITDIINNRRTVFVERDLGKFKAGLKNFKTYPTHLFARNDFDINPNGLDHELTFTDILPPQPGDSLYYELGTWDKRDFKVDTPLRMIGRLDPNSELVSSIHFELKHNRYLSEEEKKKIDNSSVVVLRLPNKEDLLISDTCIEPFRPPKDIDDDSDEAR